MERRPAASMGLEKSASGKSKVLSDGFWVTVPSVRLAVSSGSEAVCSYCLGVPFLCLATCPVKSWFACLPPCYPCLWPELPLQPESLELPPSYSPSGHLARHAVSSCPGITSSEDGSGAVGAGALSWATRVHLRTCIFSFFDTSGHTGSA